MDSRSNSYGPSTWAEETWVYLFIMGASISFLGLYVFFPIRFIAVWNTFWNGLNLALTWALQGWSGVILVWGFVIVLGFMLAAAPVLALEKLYLWIKGGEDNTESVSATSEYRIDDELE